MNEVIRAASEVQALCVANGWRFCFIGGLAVLRWGEPRETVDVDLTLLTGFGGEAPFIAAIKDWLDIEGVIIRQSGTLDWLYVVAQLAPLAELKEAPEILDELERRRAEFERNP